MAYIEQQPDIPVNTTVLLNSLLTQTAKKRATSLQQTKVRDYFKV